VGAHLDFSPDADCTYLSRDGGLTWEDVADQTSERAAVLALRRGRRRPVCARFLLRSPRSSFPPLSAPPLLHAPVPTPHSCSLSVYSVHILAHVTLLPC
jgi:hypothetical protein